MKIEMKQNMEPKTSYIQERKKERKTELGVIARLMYLAYEDAVELRRSD
jgi:hypothetical protein